MDLDELTNRQLEYMKCFWAQPDVELCKKDLINNFSAKGYSPNNISYMLSTLTKHGCLTARREGRNFYYKSCLTEKEYSKKLVNTQLKKNLGKPLNMILASFCGKAEPTESDFEKIEEWLKKLTNEMGD